MKYDVNLDLVNFKTFEQNHGLDIDGKNQKYLTNRIYVHLEPYTPKDAGGLASIVDIGSDYVHYKSPYAHYMHEGKLYIDPKYQKGAFFNESYGFWSRPGILKEKSDIELEYQGSPMRGSFWPERMWADKDETILSEVQKFNDGGKGNV